MAYQRARWGSTMEPSWRLPSAWWWCTGSLPVLVGDEVFNVRKRVFHAAGEHVRRLAVATLSAQFRGLFRHFLTAHALKRRGLHHFAAQRLAQFAQVE